MKNSKRSLALAAILLAASAANATLTNEKVTLKGNMIVEYNQTPKSVESLQEAFSEGMFYGRLRANTFYWDWESEKAGLDNKAIGLGGSFVYKSAPLYGFSATAGMYTSQVPMPYRMDVDELGKMKAGKDVLSRYDTTQTGSYGMSVMAQAYIQYDMKKTSVKFGRQLVESVFTASNDTKMIPNAFEGVTVADKTLPQTTIQLAYLTKQKLRDHTVSHDVLAVDGWEQNDDSAVNKNLTVERIGDNNKLVIGSLTNKSIKNLKANVSYALVPNVVSNITLEAHYKIPVVGKWSITPGFRYMKQIDGLNADYDVANLKGNHDGYKDSQSLDSSLSAVRVDVGDGAFLGRLGYSHIADEADIIAPWRGFPTGGFTRAMAQYNWYANTTTYMARLGYDFGKANLIPGFSLMGRYAIQDFDDSKAGVQADSTVIHIDARQNISNNMELKLRVGIVNADTSSVDKTDVSYNEYRVELNYFF